MQQLHDSARCHCSINIVVVINVINYSKVRPTLIYIYIYVYIYNIMQFIRNYFCSIVYTSVGLTLLLLITLMTITTLILQLHGSSLGYCGILAIPLSSLITLMATSMQHFGNSIVVTVVISVINNSKIRPTLIHIILHNLFENIFATLYISMSVLLYYY